MTRRSVALRVTGLWLLTVTLWWVTVPAAQQEPQLPQTVPTLRLQFSPKHHVLLQALVEAERAHGRPQDGRPWVPARLLSDETALACKVRLHGDSQNHSMNEKVSFRVRLKNGLYRGMRDFRLIIPYDRGYFLETCAEWWNRRLGLVPCKALLVDAETNTGDWGVYALVESLGKEQLEREGRPFAPIFRTGVQLNRDENRREFLYHPALFRQRMDRVPNEDSVSSLFHEILRIFRENEELDPADVRALTHLIDLDKWAAASALSRLLGSHSVAAHNTIVYFNSSTGLFEPIILDPESDGLIQDRSLSDFEAPFFAAGFEPFFHELLGVPEFLALRDRHLERLVAEAEPFFDHYLSLQPLLPAILMDPTTLLPGTWGSETLHHPSKKELSGYYAFVGRHFRENLQTIRSYLASSPRPPQWRRKKGRSSEVTKVVLGDAVCGADNSSVVRIRDFSRADARLQSLSVLGKGAHRVTCEGATATDTSKQRVFSWPPRKLSSLAEIRLTGFDPSIHRLRLSAIDTHGQVIPSYVVTSDPQHVSLPLGKTPGDVILAAGIPVTLLKDEWVIPAGSYPVNRTLIIPRGRRVRFSAGVVLRFAPGTSLVSYAPINVAGTPNAPVVFDESVPGRGWGTFAILSTNASLKPALSSIQSLVCANARGATENGLTFTGGLSCFASDLRVFQSVFVSSGQDDALNVKRSRVTIDECVFINSVADAVDLDWCEASVRRCLFLRSAGDGIDLSGGKIEIEANVILTAADKGVSAGERTNVKISRTLLAGCAIGVASKDGSRVSSEGNTILATQTAWAAYQKKPIFSGGQITSTGDSVMGCDTLERKDRVSRITRTGTRVDLGHQAIQDFASTEKVPQALAALLERLPPSLQGALTGWALTEGDTWTRYPAVN